MFDRRIILYILACQNDIISQNDGFPSEVMGACARSSHPSPPPPCQPAVRAHPADKTLALPQVHAPTNAPSRIPFRRRWRVCVSPRAHARAPRPSAALAISFQLLLRHTQTAPTRPAGNNNVPAGKKVIIFIDRPPPVRARPTNNTLFFDEALRGCSIGE